MCICCRQRDRTSDGNDNTQGQETQRVPPVTVPPRPHRSNECFAEEERTSSTPELLCGENAPSKASQQKYPELQDYGSVEDLKQLPVKEMKILLTMNRVDFNGCIEKGDLLEKLSRLWDDYHQHKGTAENIPTEELCKLCMDAPLDCVLLECGHIASCVDCGRKLAECPICRQYVVRVVRTFKA